MPKKRDPLERFFEKVRVDPVSGCWGWFGALDGSGYSKFSDEDRRTVSGHTWCYKRFVGPIPDGLELDHLCRNIVCVNFNHLEAVTPQENNDRRLKALEGTYSNRNPSVCRAGHDIDPATAIPRPNGGWTCRTCRQERQKDYLRRKRSRLLTCEEVSV